MSRKIELVVVPTTIGAGRDAGKTFKITEMAAIPAEKWAWRFFIALKGTTASIPEEIAPLGMIAVAIRGLNSFLAADVDFAKLEPLLNEMMTCVECIRDVNAIDKMTGLPVATKVVSPDDIEDITTVAWLRSEVLRVHTNFSLVDGLLSWVALTKAALKDSQTT